MEQKVLEILELGLKEDGTFYSNEEKTAMLLTLIEKACKQYNIRRIYNGSLY
jgi:hypothetical protein